MLSNAYVRACARCGPLSLRVSSVLPRIHPALVFSRVCVCTWRGASLSSRDSVGGWVVRARLANAFPRARALPTSYTPRRVSRTCVSGAAGNFLVVVVYIDSNGPWEPSSVIASPLCVYRLRVCGTVSRVRVRWMHVCIHRGIQRR